jgi:predicted metal-dependent phosphoesterase TrpH
MTPYQALCPRWNKAKAQGIRVIPGIEFSAEYKSELHILGYGFDPENSLILEASGWADSQRANRNRG